MCRCQPARLWQSPRFFAPPTRWAKGGVRPLCCSDPFRRLVSKCFCLGAKEEFSACFEGRNFGVGCPGGVEVVAHTLRDFVNNHTGEGLAALKVDFRNAFNCVDRSCFLSSVHHSFPGLYDQPLQHFLFLWSTTG